MVGIRVAAPLPLSLAERRRVAGRHRRLAVVGVEVRAVLNAVDFTKGDYSYYYQQYYYYRREGYGPSDRDKKPEARESASHSSPAGEADS